MSFVIHLLAIMHAPAVEAGPSFRRAQCPAVGRGEWTAHVNAMPGPNARRTLIVSGVIGVKPAARTRLRLAPEVMESDPPQYTVILDVQLPRQPTIDMLERRQVRGEWPVRGRVGAVHIRCGNRIIASVRSPVVAH
jgi:hypothetical protein